MESISSKVFLLDEMADFQQQKSLVLSFYSELEKATSETIDEVLAKYLAPDFIGMGSILSVKRKVQNQWHKHFGGLC